VVAGNLHTHWTRSDAKLAPTEVIEFYQQRGCDFI
jgi:predicted metal-dependent phosphoesterase TrpH